MIAHAYNSSVPKTEVERFQIQGQCELPSEILSPRKQKSKHLNAIICDKEVETTFKIKADQGNISIANSSHSNAVFNNNYPHNLMAKEYYAQSYSVAGQNTSLNQAPLIGSKKKYLFLYPTLCFVMVLKWLFRKNTQSSPS